MTALRDVDDNMLTTLGSASSLVTDVVRLHRETVAELEPRWYDASDLLTAATALLRARSPESAPSTAKSSTAATPSTATPSAATTPTASSSTATPFASTELGPVLLYLPQELSRAETAFARSLAGLTDLRVLAGITGNPRADQGVVATLATLAPGFTAPASGGCEAFAGRILNASDSDDEVRCVVREVVHTLQTVPAHRIAVLYAARSPYARLLHEHLGSAGITTNGPGVRPVNERAVSRLVLGLLETSRTDFRRDDVLRALGEVGARDFAGERISISRWERISREAGVVAGETWDTRLATYIDSHTATIETEQQKDEPYQSTIARAQRDRKTAVALRQFMVELREWFAAIAGPRSWEDIAAWARGLTHSLLPPDDVARMPMEEQYAASVIERTLHGLAALDETGSIPTVEGLEEVLALELESALPRVGRFGEGVLVAPVTHAIGLDLDVVYLVACPRTSFRDGSTTTPCCPSGSVR